MRRMLILALALLAVAPATVAAHEGNPNYESRVLSVSPAVDGVRVEVVNYDDSLNLVNTSGKTVTVEGYEEEPYARVQGDGTVQVNQKSPATYLNDDRYGKAEVPASADPKAPPSWKTIDKTGRFTWHDHRIHWMSSAADPPQLKDKDRRTKIFGWTVPLTVDGQRATVSGDLFWKPSDDSGVPLALLLAIPLIIGAGVALLVVARRRRDRRPSGEAW